MDAPTGDNQISPEEGPPSPTHSDLGTERDLSPIFTPKPEPDELEAVEEEIVVEEEVAVEEEIAYPKAECTICKKTVTKWLDLIILPDGERLTKIGLMLEREKALARKPYCLECADAQVWYWLLVNVDRSRNIRLTPAQWRQRVIYNLETNFGLVKRRVNNRLMMADYFKFCRGCDNINAHVDIPGQPCKACRNRPRCNYCGRNRLGLRGTRARAIRCSRCRTKSSLAFALPPVDPVILPDPTPEGSEADHEEAA
ncbi:uncharacterized protein B0H64DRAFT_395079 [Chaetomium fimeti]|uniref:Uncharacterized protein n=1 Tax=Chaetomium fimeti TaxID=1854472 RepID=A0AAE0LS13_9PEZI|nr:hypothetical protein B0H64DRAFT_395079 [Chaetomium fimeti]